MERILQPIAGHHPASPSPARPSSGLHHGAPSIAIHPQPIGPSPTLGVAPKTAADFLRALRKRFWMVLLVAIVTGAAGAAWVVRQPNVYRAAGMIRIQPPKFDGALGLMVATGHVSPGGRETDEKYVPNWIATLRGRAMAEALVARPEVQHLLGNVPDPAGEVVESIKPTGLPGTTIFEVSLESTDPERAAGLLKALLELFKERARQENMEEVDQSISYAQKYLKQLSEELKAIDDRITGILKSAPIFAPGGKSRLEEEYSQTTEILSQERLRFNEFADEERIARLFPNLKRESTGHEAQLVELKKEEKKLTNQLKRLKSIIPEHKFDKDPTSKYFAEMLSGVLDDIKVIEEQLEGQRPPNVAGLRMSHSGEEIQRLEARTKLLMDRMQQSMPQFQTYLTLLKDRDRKSEAISAVDAERNKFAAMTHSMREPVTITRQPDVPVAPVRPKRAMLIGLFSGLGIALGAGLVCFLEFLDRSVKVPEHLSVGLGLPLFGVVPRMKRLARTHRGGHLWTPGAPESVEADAYRNLRASLLGLHGPDGRPIVTLLMTSAKAGEGKSTTALNLAATCARAGERTLLMDVDLRRPSLGGVFDPVDDEPQLGLVDVLRGELPWQRTVVRTDIPNLDFLPTGDPSGIPIEILGSLELRQLVAAVSGHYHRVILDGPAILGLADCRMLGRIVDAAVMVVRCGAHELRPLQRAKAMMEQSRVPIAGVVFNGLCDDLDNWSSYGPGNPFLTPDVASRAVPSARGLAAPVDEEAEAAV